MEPILCMTDHWMVYYLNQNTIALPLRQNISLTIGFFFSFFWGGGREGGVEVGWGWCMHDKIMSPHYGSQIIGKLKKKDK